MKEDGNMVSEDSADDFPEGNQTLLREADAREEQLTFVDEINGPARLRNTDENDEDGFVDDNEPELYEFAAKSMMEVLMENPLSSNKLSPIGYVCPLCMDDETIHHEMSFKVASHLRRHINSKIHSGLKKWKRKLEVDQNGRVGFHGPICMTVRPSVQSRLSSSNSPANVARHYHQFESRAYRSQTWRRERGLALYEYERNPSS